MVLAVTPALYEDLPQPIVAIGNEYASGAVIAPHAHRRSQLVYAATGVMTVGTTVGSWVVPPQRAVWVPAGIRHEIRMTGTVAMRSLFLAATLDSVPARCQVVAVSPLLRALILAAVELPVAYESDSRAGRIMALILDEIRQMPVLPLHAPLASDPRLAKICRMLVADPGTGHSLDACAAASGMSRRNFTRRFHQDTGMSFAAWRQQIRLLAALARPAAGEPVAAVARSLGYRSPSAFTAMFRRALGTTPQHYFVG